MNNRPDGFVELDDYERGGLMVTAFVYAVKWAFALGIINTVMAAIWAPEMVDSAVWWYPVTFVVMFLWKRNRLLADAHEIINRINFLKKQNDQA